MIDFKAKREAAAVRKLKRQTKAKTLWPKKVKKIPKANRIKRLKKKGLVDWSIAVRRRDGNKCLMCGKTEYLQAHHWLFRRSHSVRLAFDIANGATLCYGCHIGRIHTDGDGDFMLRLADRMIAIVSPEKVAEMRETARHPSPVNEDELRSLVGHLASIATQAKNFTPAATNPAAPTPAPDQEIIGRNPALD